MQIRSLLLGSAIAIAAISSAHATDAVVPDDTPSFYTDKVEACDAYGTGFAKLPGTDTCLKVSGQVRIEGRVSNHARGAILNRSSITFETRSDPW